MSIKQEPVAVMEFYTDGWDLVEGIDTDWLETLPFGTKLYTHPYVPTERQPKQEPVEIPEGFSLIAVKGFDELMYWLDRCEHKGHLENCPDLIEPYEAFEYRNIDAAQSKREPLTDEQILELNFDVEFCTLCDDDEALLDFARAIEAAHGIKE
jgi:hypothetical protein